LTILGYLLYNLGRCLLKAVFPGNAEGEAAAPDGKGEVEPMVLDLECGNYIHPRDALTRSVAGQTYYFCSRECRDAFCERHRDEPTCSSKE
ncbi:MAG: hypothetical protein A2091_01740, partial [Desulfuromonadales bacterium GWD2_61_12]